MSQEQAVSTGRQWYENPKLIIAALLVVAFIVFVVVNGEEVNVDFVVSDVDIALAWALLISGVVGFLAGALFGWTRFRR